MTESLHDFGSIARLRAWRGVSRVLGLVVLAIGLLSLGGWLFHLDALKSLSAGLPPMKLNTAIALSVCGVWLAFLYRGEKSNQLAGVFCWGAGLFVALLGLTTLAEYAVGGDFGIDRFLVGAAAFQQPPAIVDRMALTTALNFFLIGAAILLLQKRGERTFAVAQMAALLALIIAFSATIGYGYGVKQFYYVAPFAPMALNTAIAFVCGTVGFLLGTAEMGWMRAAVTSTPGGALLRRLVPVTFVVAASIGWFRLKGESLGWYGTALGTSMLVVALIVIYWLALWISSRWIDRAEAERQRAAAAVRESEEQYRILFTSMDEGFCTIELKFDENERPIDYRFLEINPAFEKQTGLKNAKGKWMRDLAPNHEQHWFDIYGRIVLTGRSERFENRAEALGRWYEVYAFRLGPAEDRRVGIVFNDITERKQREEEMRKAHERAERASRTKDQFLAALSHELRTPLNPVLMTASVLRDDDRLPADARDQLAMMQRNIELEARLIDDLLDLTRIAHGKLALRLETCDAHSLLALAVEMVRSDARAKAIMLDVDLRAPHATLAADPARLQQVFWNVLKNAVKFTPDFGRVSVRSRNESDALVIEISDTGVGIDPDVAEKIFLPFEQAATVQQDRRFGGLGLGLSISKAIVDLHHGKISAQSGGEGQGATFHIELPTTSIGLTNLGISPTGDANAGKRKIAQTQTSLRVLLVEDHEETIRVLDRLLTRAGHHVVTAMTVAQGMAAAEHERFDVLISDVGLPDGTGFDLMEQLRKRHCLPGIALSGYGMDEDLRRSREAGFAAHLIKPIDFERLQTAVSELVATE